jgi:hypothetical protein
MKRLKCSNQIFGFDAAINYNTTDNMVEAIAAALSNVGFFDNVPRYPISTAIC